MSDTQMSSDGSSKDAKTTGQLSIPETQDSGEEGLSRIQTRNKGEKKVKYPK